MIVSVEWDDLVYCVGYRNAWMLINHPPFTCSWCHCPIEVFIDTTARSLSIDHVDDDHSNNAYDNLQPLHVRCNSQKAVAAQKARDPDAFFRVRSESGKRNVENGTLERARRASQPARGKDQGQKNVESGHWAQIAIEGRRLGGIASGAMPERKAFMRSLGRKWASVGGQAAQASGATRRAAEVAHTRQKKCGICEVTGNAIKMGWHKKNTGHDDLETISE